jgi:hypothetical protein
VRLLAVPAGVLLLAACTSGAPEQEDEATEIPEELAGAAPAVIAAGDDIGTPMAERVAVLGLLNKRNNISRDIELKPGEQRRVGDVVVRLSACERTKPWEEPPQTGAFVQVVVQERRDAESDLAWHRVFSGWLFKESPSLNVVEHPIYDVWVKDCKMSFPGEEAPAADEDDAAPATRAPAPSATPSPTATPEPAAPSNDT